jgi:hypothetical protein
MPQSKVALILLECWSFELRNDYKGGNVMKCSKSNILCYLDLNMFDTLLLVDNMDMLLLFF